MVRYVKVIISGSDANLKTIQVDNLIPGYIVLGGGSGSLYSVPPTSIFSGSIAITGSLSGSFTGSLLGTASYAINALSASHAISASWAPNPLSGGTLGYISRWTGPTTLSTSSIYETSNNIIIGGTTDAGYKLDVVGTLRIVSGATFNSNINNTAGDYQFRSTSFLYSTSNNWNLKLYDSSAINKIYLNTNGTSFINGNLLVGTTTDAGYSLQVNGRIYYTYDSSPTLITNEVQGNSWRTLLLSGGRSGGYGGGFDFRTGTNGNVASTQRCFIVHRNGAIGAGSEPDDGFLQNAGRSSFNTYYNTAPSATYSRAFFGASLSSANYNYYSRSNGYIFPLIAAGTTNNLSATSGNAVGGQIGWQYDPELGGYASSFIWSMINESRVAVEIMRLRSAYGGRLGLRTNNPTAHIHIGSGSTVAGGAPLKFTSGSTTTVYEPGAVEYDGTDFFVSNNNNRYRVAKVLVASATLDFPNTGANDQSDLTVSITGATEGDVVAIGAPSGSMTNGTFFGWVSSTDTVTIRFHNTSGGSHDPASGTFKIKVFKD